MDGREAPTDELDELRAEWRAALTAAREALEANEDVLPAEELHDEERRLRGEYGSAAELLRRYALDEGLPPELAQPFLPRGLTRHALGLTPAVLACVFELDGVLVASTRLHVEAWQRAFDELLGPRIDAGYERVTSPFEPQLDYPAHVEGRTRLDGVRSFLASRGIRLPEGSPDDPPGSETVHGVANRKHEQFDLLFAEHGVSAFDGCRHYVRLARDAGIACAVVSASAHMHAILERAGLAELLSEVTVSEAGGLTEACRLLDVAPQDAAAFVASRAGVEAAHAAGFAFVVAIDPDRHSRHVRTLRAAGADVVVPALAELLVRAR